MQNTPTDVVALAMQRSTDQRYMIARRGPAESGAGNWEFPGGKMEADETQPVALVREILEEFQVMINPEDLNFVDSHLFSYPTRVIRLHLWKIVVLAVPQMQLIEHDQIAWCTPKEMAGYNISPADVFFINKLL